MPEFQMPIGDTQESHAQWNNLDPFVRGYIEAMFFCEANPDNPEMEHAEFADLSFAAMMTICADCNAFQMENQDDLDGAYNLYQMDDDQLGRDFWFTRNGHGVGYWDRDMDDLGDRLTEGAHKFGEQWVYRGDDGKVYIS